MNAKTPRRMFAVILSAAMLLSCLLCSGFAVSAVEENGTDSRVYMEADKTYFEACIDAGTAPQKEGYLFAGWVAQTADGKGVAIKSKTDAVLSQAGVTVTAKFIPAHLAGVACQVKANTYDEGVEKTDLRIVSTVDNGTYQGFGFNLYKRTEDGEVKLCGYEEGKQNPAQTLDRYTGLYVYSGGEKTVKTPADIFGAEAEGFYFTTVRIGNIPQAVYESCIFIIRPYWITADGTYVEGLGEMDRVSDGKNGIVNISVNLKDAANIAAGMMNVKYDTENFIFVSADAGRVFEEMQFVEENGVVKCVGNVADITENAPNANDIYVNLRFQKTGTAAAGTSSFSAEAVEFCDKDENTIEITVEDVIY